MREVQRKLEKNKTKNDSISETQLNESAMEATAQADIIFMKSMVINDDVMDLFLQKLNFTRKHRQAMLLDKSIHLKEQFPYFFTNPALVNLKNFTCLYAFLIFQTLFQILKEFELANEEVNCHAFLEKWPILAPKLWDVLTKHYKQNDFATGWAKDIEDVLVLLKMFPCRQVGRNVIATNKAFETSVKTFIQFEPVRKLQDFM